MNKSRLPILIFLAVTTLCVMGAETEEGAFPIGALIAKKLLFKAGARTAAGMGARAAFGAGAGLSGRPLFGAARHAAGATRLGNAGHVGRLQTLNRMRDTGSMLAPRQPGSLGGFGSRQPFNLRRAGHVMREGRHVPFGETSAETTQRGSIRNWFRNRREVQQQRVPEPASDTGTDYKELYDRYQYVKERLEELSNKNQTNNSTEESAQDEEN